MSWPRSGSTISSRAELIFFVPQLFWLEVLVRSTLFFFDLLFNLALEPKTAPEAFDVLGWPVFEISAYALN